MKRSVLTAAVVIAATIALAGCSAPAVSGQPAASAPAAEATSPAPVVASTPRAEPAAEDAGAAYLAAVREAQTEFATQIPNATDEQLLQLGAQACDQLAANADTSTLSLIEGEQAAANGYYYDSAAVISSARVTLCVA